MTAFRKIGHNARVINLSNIKKKFPGFFGVVKINFYLSTGKVISPGVQYNRRNKGGVLTVYGWLLSTFLARVMDVPAARSLPDQQFLSLSLGMLRSVYNDKRSIFNEMFCKHDRNSAYRWIWRIKRIKG